MKRFINVFLLIVEVILFIGAFALNYFTVKKMGVLRYVVNKNIQWEKNYPIDMIKYVVLAALMLFLLGTIMRWRGKGKRILFFISCAVFVGIDIFILGNSTVNCRAYYFIVLILIVAALVQFVNGMVFLSGENT